MSRWHSVLSLAVAGFLVGCQASPHLEVESPGTAVKSVIPKMGLHEAMTFGDIPLCIKGAGPGTVRIESVEVPEGSSLEITSFAVSDERDTFGNDRVTLKGAGYDPADRDLSRRCDDEAGWLKVEVSRSTAASASADELIVRYSSGDGSAERTAHVPYAIVLCATEETEIEHC